MTESPPDGVTGIRLVGERSRTRNRMIFDHENEKKDRTWRRKGWAGLKRWRKGVDLSLMSASSTPFTLRLWPTHHPSASATFCLIVSLSFRKLAKLPLGQKNLGGSLLSRGFSTLKSAEFWQLLLMGRSSMLTSLQKSTWSGVDFWKASRNSLLGFLSELSFNTFTSVPIWKCLEGSGWFHLSRICNAPKC